MSPPPISIAICYPSAEEINTQFASSLIAMLVRNKIPIAGIMNVSSSRIAHNRNMLVELAKKSKATHSLFIDADMIFPNDSLTRLLAHDFDIVGATACKRDENGDAVGITITGERLRVPSPPVKMRLLGLPLCLIKMSVFDKLAMPYFAEPPRKMMAPDPLTDHELMPEDEYFCNQALKAGFDIYCDIELSIKIGHRGAKTYYIMKPVEE
jgi:hypothetical protein